LPSPSPHRPLTRGLMAVVTAGLLLSCTAPGSGSTVPGEPPSAQTADQAVSMREPRRYPEMPAQPEAIADRLVELETAIRDPATPDAVVAPLAHQQQVIYRVLARQTALATAVLQHLSLLHI
jgi:hypothetical protein